MKSNRSVGFRHGSYGSGTRRPPRMAGCPCRKLKLEHIDGVARPRSATNARALCGTRHAEPARPSAAIGAFGPRCNIFGTIRERGEDGARQR
jgi:hypothetical protein